MLLPPSETGRRPTLDFTDPYSCYITCDRDEAIMFAARFACPMLYEVTLLEEPLVDDTLDPEQKTSFRCRRARIWRQETISREDLFRVRMRLEALARGDCDPAPVDCPPVEDVALGRMLET
jgi:hypothetical protein